MSVGWFEINHSKQEHTRQPTDFDISTYTSVFKKKNKAEIRMIIPFLFGK